MKIIITEEQLKMLQESDKDFKKTKSLLLSMYNDGYNTNEIKSYTGLSDDIIILCLKDIELTGDNLSCDEIHDYLYNVLWNTDLINKDKSFDDGTSIDVYIDTYGPTIGFEYKYYEGQSIDGYATFLYESSCRLPIDLVSTKINGEYGGDIDEYLGENKEFLSYPDFKTIKTFGDIINFFNTHYFTILKNRLDKYLDEERDNFF